MAGGATSGYCDTGIFGIDSRPARAIPSATTQAKIGRSIKNCGMFTHFLEALKLPIGAPCTTGTDWLRRWPKAGREGIQPTSRFSRIALGLSRFILALRRSRIFGCLAATGPRLYLAGHAARIRRGSLPGYGRHRRTRPDFREPLDNNDVAGIQTLCDDPFPMADLADLHRRGSHLAILDHHQCAQAVGGPLDRLLIQEERSVGKECVRTSGYRWSPEH